MSPQAESEQLVIDRRRDLSHIINTDLKHEDLVDASKSTLERAVVLSSPQAVQVATLLKSIDGRPLRDNVLILPLPPNERYASILLPEASHEDQTAGIVVAVGPGHYEGGRLVPCDVREGNYVTFNTYSAKKVQVGEIEVVQVAEQDINFVVGK